MSAFGSEEELLAQLMSQGEVAKSTPGVSAADTGAGGDDEIPLRTRPHQRKRKAAVSSGLGEAVVSAVPVSEAVTLTGLRVGDHVEAAPPKRTKVASASGKGRLGVIAEEARLEDEGFIRHVADRLKHEGLDRVSQVHGSPKENRAKAFDSVLPGLHNLYLVDGLEEDYVLKEQVTALEAGLLVEKTERKNVTRQRDAAREKSEKLSAELKKVKDRAGALERELAECSSLREEVSMLKDKVAAIPEVVEREKEEAVVHFQASEEFLALKKEAYDTGLKEGFKEGYSKSFRTLSEKGWINKEKYFADTAREKEERALRDAGRNIVVDLEDGAEEENRSSEDVPGDTEGQEVVGEAVVTEEGAFQTPVRPQTSAGGEEGSASARAGLKFNGDPLTPGITPGEEGARS